MLDDADTRPTPVEALDADLAGLSLTPVGHYQPREDLGPGRRDRNQGGRIGGVCFCQHRRVRSMATEDREIMTTLIPRIHPRNRLGTPNPAAPTLGVRHGC